SRTKPDARASPGRSGNAGAAGLCLELRNSLETATRRNSFGDYQRQTAARDRRATNSELKRRSNKTRRPGVCRLPTPNSRRQAGRSGTKARRAKKHSLRIPALAKVTVICHKPTMEEP